MNNTSLFLLDYIEIVFQFVKASIMSTHKSISQQLACKDIAHQPYDDQKLIFKKLFEPALREGPKCCSFCIVVLK